MARWIKIDRLEAILRTDLRDDKYVLHLIDQVQGLAEAEIGEQATPSNALQSVFAEIVARKWQVGESARLNPAGFQSDTTGPFTIQDPGARTAGLGLTDREKLDLRKAIGKPPGLWVQPTTRGDRLETAPIHGDDLTDEADPVEILTAAQQDLGR
jgi:hypothetical protein